MTPTASSNQHRVDGDASLPRYPVGEVARRLDVPTATLRSWTQRYGVGPAEHSAGRHRLYSEADVALLQRMHALIRQGASPRSAAQSLRESAVPARGDVASVLDAAMSLDTDAASHALDRHLRHYGVIDTWESLIRPAFAAIDGNQLRGMGCIDVEHALSWTVTRCLQQQPMASDPSDPVILACTEGETHTLALEALRAALSERDRAVLMLGANTPPRAVMDALTGRPATTAVALFSQTERTADVQTSNALAAAANVTLTGPGWVNAVVPPGVQWVNSLEDAVEGLVSDRSPTSATPL